MRKKILSEVVVTIASAASVLALAGCGGTADTTSTTAESSHVSEAETSTSVTTAENNSATDSQTGTSESSSSSADSSESATTTVTSDSESLSPLDNGKVSSENIQIDIKGYKVFPAGTGGAKNSLNPVVVFYYDATNLSDKEIDALSAWTEVLDAYQNNSENERNVLGTGIFVDDTIPAEDGTALMKKGETKSYYKSYELTDSTTSVTLQSHDGLGGAKLGDDIVVRVMS